MADVDLLADVDPLADVVADVVDPLVAKDPLVVAVDPLAKDFDVVDPLVGDDVDPLGMNEFSSLAKDMDPDQFFGVLKKKVNEIETAFGTGTQQTPEPESESEPEPERLWWKYYPQEQESESEPEPESKPQELDPIATPPSLDHLIHK